MYQWLIYIDWKFMFPVADILTAASKRKSMTEFVGMLYSVSPTTNHEWL